MFLRCSISVSFFSLFRWWFEEMCSHWSQIRGKLEELFYGLVFWGFLFAKKLVETEEFENFESGFLCDPFFPLPRPSLFFCHWCWIEAVQLPRSYFHLCLELALKWNVLVRNWKISCLFLLQNYREEGKCFESDSLSAFLHLSSFKNEVFINMIDISSWFLGLKVVSLF